MAAEDYYDLFDPDAMDAEWEDEDYSPGMLSEPIEKTCYKCGKRQLYWSRRDNMWQLVDQLGYVHVCQAADEFPDL